MEFSSDLSWLGVSTQIFFTDTLLAGDNAIIIAAACSILPRRLVPRAIAVGAIGAVVLRVLLALMANVLMALPLLKALAGLMLALFAINLRANSGAAAESGNSDKLNVDPDLNNEVDFMGAALFILLADTIMSLDNVVAISAISQGSMGYLILGLGLSIPFVFFGSFLLTEVIAEYPALVSLGAALLGWVSGNLIVTDPLWSGWVQANAEALGVLVPLALAIFVVAEGAITGNARGLQIVRATPSLPSRMRPARPPAAGSVERSPATAIKPATFELLQREALPATAGGTEPQAAPVVIFEPPSKSSAGPSDKVVLIGLLVLLALVGGVLAIAIAMAPPDMR